MSTATPAPTPEPRPMIDTEALASDCYATAACETAEHIVYVFDVAQDEGHPFSERHAADVVYAALLASKNLHAKFEAHIVRALEMQAYVDDELRRRREASGGSD